MDTQDKLREKLISKIENSRRLGLEHPLSAEHENALRQGIDFHNTGYLSEAEDSYKRILTEDPDQAVPLNLLGVLAHQMGQNDVALSLIENALTIIPDYAEAHYNHALVLMELGRMSDAVDSCMMALLIIPEYAEAKNLMGKICNTLGDFGAAIKNYQAAVNINPNFEDGYYNLGVVYYELKNFEQAILYFQKSLTLNPKSLPATTNLGVCYKELHQYSLAIECFEKALVLDPNYSEAYFNLANVFLLQEKFVESLMYLRVAVKLSPETSLYWSGMEKPLKQMSFTSIDDSLLDDLCELLQCSTVNPTVLFNPILSALKLDETFSDALQIAVVEEKIQNFNAVKISEILSGIPLFLSLMKQCLMSDLQIEDMLTRVRRDLLKVISEGDVIEAIIPFVSVLAIQCFHNEYIFSVTEHENELLDTLELEINDIIDHNGLISIQKVVILSAYRPLFLYPWAKKYIGSVENQWIADVLCQQISEPLEEREIRSQISSVTPVENSVSLAVRQQYEESPYPRWTKVGLSDKGMRIQDVLKQVSMDIDVVDNELTDTPDILIAGCGTGQQALATKNRFENSKVLAIDLSLSSLSYAIRKTKEYGVKGIDYYQADIMELSCLNRKFDLIESSGVLHHLESPDAGWENLVNLLKPKGLMNIGLYSKFAREHLSNITSIIPIEKDCSPLQAIQKSRENIISLAKSGQKDMERVCKSIDFYSLSTCRDLLYHVQEIRFDLTEIELMLEKLHLEFLGFEIPEPSIIKRFKRDYPNKDDVRSLQCWHEFEKNNPYIFLGMYQFWCRKKS
ncbi:tetratricopeptide repeat protein [Kiloniella sp.]|uniref:tetratricopeptide repeat protein n=1 Tax=Kiloniella sp. TaxID=1938587 RepID=UPI003A90B1FE